eukprot:jgi/Hompol1/513/HPOL_000519-RA
MAMAQAHAHSIAQAIPPATGAAFHDFAPAAPIAAKPGRQSIHSLHPSIHTASPSSDPLAHQLPLSHQHQHQQATAPPAMLPYPSPRPSPIDPLSQTSSQDAACPSNSLPLH